MSDEDAQPTTPEEMVLWMLAQSGDDAAGPVVCEPEPGGAWYCAVKLRNGMTWEGRVFPVSISGPDEEST
jgi:hypothetical protein